MFCPLCGSASSVIKSVSPRRRGSDAPESDTPTVTSWWWRRRQCTVCKHRWTTLEVTEAIVDKAAQLDRLLEIIAVDKEA